MASINFVDQTTVVPASWLNDVNALVYTVFGGTVSVPSAGKIFRSNGTAMVASTSTFADTYGINTILYASAANAVTGLATANGGVLNTSSAGVPSITATPTLGASGTLGSVTMGNATTGLLTLQPVTGALGTVTVSLPAATDTLVGKATTDVLTNKTLTNPANTLQALTDAAPTTWDTSLGAIATWTMGASRTISAPTNLKTGGRYILIISQDATGGRQVTWNGVFKNAAGAMPQPNPQASAATVFTFTSPDGTNLRLETNEAMVLISTGTASSSATLDFTNLKGFDTFMFVFEDIIPATNAASLDSRVSTDNGGTWLSSGSYHYAAIIENTGGAGTLSATAQTQWVEALSVSNSAGWGIQGQIVLYNASGTNPHSITYQLSYLNSAAVVEGVMGTGKVEQGASAINGVRFVFSAGNIASGTIKCYGIRG